MYNFSGKKAVVTGAAQGLGKSIALRLLEDGAEGVALLDLKADALEQAASALDPSGKRALPVPCNVADPESVAQAFRAVLERFGQVDILVCNAGITRDAMAHKMTNAQFDEVIKVSLYGTFYCVKQVIDGMRERCSGRIIAMSSIASRGNVGQANYAAAKAGIIGLTKTLSMELGPKNVTVNCVAPSMINTDIIKTIPEKILASMAASVPMRRIGEPREVADLVAYLASDEAGYINGQCINITGGYW
jgi:NAD(P)-dependent dehydrogenase (short-subunit alcohol dehydrogenase family)